MLTFILISILAAMTAATLLIATAAVAVILAFCIVLVLTALRKRAVRRELVAYRREVRIRDRMAEQGAEPAYTWDRT